MGIRELRNKYEDLFNEFFKSYPRHVDRAQAFDEFIALGEEGFDLQFVIGKSKSYSRNVDPQQLQYVPSPRSWLKGRRWEDVDLLSDQRVSVREFFIRAYQDADAAVVERKYGFVYSDPPVPDDVTDIAAWHRDARKTWVGKVANHLLNGAEAPE